MSKYMTTTRLTLVSGLLLANAAMAAPYLVSDRYPADAIQPESFIINISGKEAVEVLAEQDEDGLYYLRYDVANLSGQKTITVKAKNSWGVSAASSPFTVTAGFPPVPAGITVIP